MTLVGDFHVIIVRLVWQDCIKARPVRKGNVNAEVVQGENTGARAVRPDPGIAPIATPSNVTAPGWLSRCWSFPLDVRQRQVHLAAGHIAGDREDGIAGPRRDERRRAGARQWPRRQGGECSGPSSGLVHYGDCRFGEPRGIRPSRLGRHPDGMDRAHRFSPFSTSFRRFRARGHVQDPVASVQ